MSQGVGKNKKMKKGIDFSKNSSSKGPLAPTLRCRQKINVKEGKIDQKGATEEKLRVEFGKNQVENIGIAMSGETVQRLYSADSGQNGAKNTEREEEVFNGKTPTALFEQRRLQKDIEPIALLSNRSRNQKNHPEELLQEAFQDQVKQKEYGNENENEGNRVSQ